MIKDLNIRSETIKFLNENIGEKLLNIGLDDNFLDMTQKAQVAKTKINQKSKIYGRDSLGECKQTKR